MTKHLHHITHRHVAGEGIDIEMTCTGARDDECHVYPDPDEEHSWEEGWTEEECREYGVPHDECIHMLNAEAWDCAQLCGPDGELVRNGAIIPKWNGLCVSWRYADTKEEA